MKELKFLISRIKDSIREEAKSHSAFENNNGCIRIMITPKCEDADKWLGGLSSFEKRANVGFGCVTTHEADIMTYEFVSEVVPGGYRDANLEYPSSMSETVSLVVLEHEGEDISDYLSIDICVSGTMNAKEDKELANRAVAAVLDWFEEPFEASPVI